MYNNEMYKMLKLVKYANQKRRNVNGAKMIVMFDVLMSWFQFLWISICDECEDLWWSMYVEISRQNSNTCSNVKLNKPDLLDLPLMQAPVVGSHATPGGQCSHPVIISGFSSGFGNSLFISRFEKQNTMILTSYAVTSVTYVVP